MPACIVLTCAGSKNVTAPTLTQSGLRIKFVANYYKATPPNLAHQHPDDPIGPDLPGLGEMRSWPSMLEDTLRLESA
jgi:hypothetical protein